MADVQRLRTYAALAVRGYRRHTAYLAAVLAGLFTNVVFGLLRSAVMVAMFATTTQIGGYSAAQAVTYVWLVQGLMAVVLMFGSTEIGQRVRTGDFTIDLLRPIDVQLAYLASDLGRAAYQLLYRGIPPVVVGSLFFQLVFPGRLTAWLMFLVSVALAVTLSYLFRFIYNLSSLWLMDFRGVALTGVILMNLFSGFVVPVGFFPDWLRTVAMATPFPSMLQTPVDIFMGRLDGMDALGGIAVQALWITVLFGIGRLLFTLGRRRLVFQGG